MAGKSKHLHIERAKRAVFNGIVPAVAFMPYREQSDSATQRGVGFDISIEQWWDWWQEPDEHGQARWLRRGRKAGCLMMLRKGDRGPYRLGNIYAGTPKDNARDRQKHSPSVASPQTRAAGSAALRAYMSKPIIGPDGTVYPRIMDAAAALGAHRDTVRRWAIAGKNGVSYLGT